MRLHDEDDEPTFFQRHRVAVIAGIVVLGGIAAYFVFTQKPAPKKKASTSIVAIMPPLPPPPPPPTPPPTPPPPQEKPPENIKQPEFQPEEKPVDEPPKPKEAEEPPPLGTNIKGDGANSFGLAAGGGNGMIGGTGKGGGGGSKWGSYAAGVQSRVVDALRTHRRTRSASLNLKVRIWVDPGGRVTRAVLGGTSGDAATDKAITEEILNGLQLNAPPDGMPMPIVMRISAKRPN